METSRGLISQDFKANFEEMQINFPQSENANWFTPDIFRSRKNTLNYEGNMTSLSKQRPSIAEKITIGGDFNALALSAAKASQKIKSDISSCLAPQDQNNEERSVDSRFETHQNRKLEFHSFNKVIIWTDIINQFMIVYLTIL